MPNGIDLPDSLRNLPDASPETLRDVAQELGRDPVFADALRREMMERMGDLMAEMFGIGPNEQWIVNGLSPATKGMAFHACERAIETGGSITHEAVNTGECGLKLSVTETATAQEGQDGPHPSKVDVHFVCMK